MDRLVDLARQYRESTDREEKAALLEAILERIRPRLYVFIARSCPKEGVEDVLQETLLGIARNLHQFYGSEDPQFWGWCYQVARRRVADQLRKDEKDPLVLVDPQELGKAAEAAGDSEPVPVEMQRDLEETLELLRQIGSPCYGYLVQVYFEDWTLQELAQSLGLDYDATRMRVSRCLKKFRELMTESQRR